MVNAIIKACLKMRLLVLIGAVVVVVMGVRAIDDNPKDAIPDISENQVIVSSDWMGRSPQDVEDQVTYPLSIAMQGIPQVREVRTISGFGFSRTYIVFEDGVDVYWARSRVLERLAVAGKDLPDGVTPTLGPDATSLGQVFWYTVDGPYDLAKLRSTQDYIVRYALQNVKGVSEVASAGGFVQEYQIDIDPERLRAHGITLEQVQMAVRASNLDVSAKTIEQADVEFLIRGVGFLQSIEDLEAVVIANQGAAAVTIADIARVQLGAAFRRGALADAERERVGGVVTIRYGANPLEVIADVKATIASLQETLPEGVEINVFYDRSDLIYETLDVLNDTLMMEILIVVVVVILFLLHLRSALIISATIPLSVLLAFIGMNFFGVGSNIMSLAGIAIAIGTVVDMGIIMAETIYRALQEDGGKSSRFKVVFDASSEVGGAILTAVATTVISFIPVFFLTGQSYKLFAPLAWTKTFILIAAAIIAITLVPVLCDLCLGGRSEKKHGRKRKVFSETMRWVASLSIAVLIAWAVLRYRGLLSMPIGWSDWMLGAVSFALAAATALRISKERLTPIEHNPMAITIVATYRPVLRFLLSQKWIVVLFFIVFTTAGSMVLLGADKTLSPLKSVINSLGGNADALPLLSDAEEEFPGMGSEFMPPLDEGSLLFMPSLLSQAGLSETLRVMQWQNEQIDSVPEVERVVGKLGRAETALDPAPVGMIETVVLLKPKQQWREGVTKDDIIQELRQKTSLPGVAPSWLQPIETRVIMLSSGIRAKIGLEIAGDDVQELIDLTLALEPIIKEVEGASDVSAMRTGGKPYIELKLDRERLAYYGLSVAKVQNVIEVALGGKQLTATVEGRERYPVRIRYERELRDNLEEIQKVLIATPEGAQIPITNVADIEYVVGPASIRGVNGRLVGYVMFNTTGVDETTLIERVQERVQEAIANNEVLWPEGYSYRWVGQYRENQRANERLAFIIPIAAVLILLLIYLHFRRFSTTLIVFLGLPLGIAGGFLMVHFWPSLQAWIFDTPQADPIYLTVAVIVGFIALAGIVIDDGVVIATYIEQTYEKRQPTTIEGIRECVVDAGSRRIRPTLMTTITTIVALVPVLMVNERGSDVMQPMALPVFGGMAIEVFTLFVVPTAMSTFMEWRLRARMVMGLPLASLPDKQEGSEETDSR